MKCRRWMAVASALLLSKALSARAADQLIPGTQLELKSTSTTEKLVFVSRGTLSVPGPSSRDAPTNGGATLQIMNPGTSESFTFDMPSVHWTATGGGTIYRYVDSLSPEPGGGAVRALKRPGTSLFTEPSSKRAQ